MPMTIRPINKEDIKDIFKINNSVQGNPWTRNAIQAEIENPLSLGWVSLDKVVITGYIFIRKNGSESEIMTVGVSPENQRKGIGEKLISHALAQLPQGSTVNLEVSHLNEGALTLYKKIGFIVTATRKSYYPDGSDGLCMQLNT